MRIKELRNQRKIKQADLAKAINVSQATMSEYENGKYEPDYETLKHLAVFFEVTIDYLLGNDTKRGPTLVSESGPIDVLDVRLNSLLSNASDETKKAMITLLEQSQRP